MTSKRLYYQDSYNMRFKARIVERFQLEDVTAVVLDKTYFYPTSGGQPHDIGKLDEIAVTNVTIREADGAVLHWVESSDIWSDAVTAEVDWLRRFDHMQQHTGQHILSQAFLRLGEAETLSFHLSGKSVTIDLQADALKPEHVEAAEQLANQIVWQNRPIRVRSVPLAEAKQMQIRKLPPTRSGMIRLVEIADFDLTACGGTHVTRTGEVGLIKIIKLERNKDKLRVEFACGQRALWDFRQKNQIVSQLMSKLTTGAPELVASVDKLQSEAKASKRTLKQQGNAILRLEAESLLAAAEKRRGKKSDPLIISRVYADSESDPGQLRALGTRLINNEGVIAFLGLAGKKSLLVFCRSADAPGEMNQLLKPALQLLGSASGGGTAEMAQGGGPQASVDRVEQALGRAQRLLIGQK